ncbi:hypothetical protein [Streptomyces sp. McG3]|uniref:hypothetical protein n=1 Tax=Streptomyces sp. McG3 TaxID=2725483 RepID=UPI001BE57A30|nr:hypothetical protein [Streptomyces sp. McG3]MBT2895638.1 hypothetical protein [Streptomyces sp. McG3]
MTAAEYRAAAERIIASDTPRFGPIHPEDFRRAEILAQLAVSASISEAAEARAAEPAQH